jgi:hypothetical protein
MIKDITALVNPAGGAGLSAIAIRDLDDLSMAQVGDWFVTRMNAELPKATPIQVVALSATARILPFRIKTPNEPHAGRVVVVPAGLPGGVAATIYQIAQFAIEDHILLLAHEKELYDSVSEFSDIPHDLALRKLVEVVDLMKTNGIPIKHTKRLMHLFRAVTGFRASPATFAERLVSQGLAVLGRNRIRAVFLPLIEGLEEASRMLSS